MTADGGLITAAGEAYDSGRGGFLCAFLFVFFSSFRVVVVVEWLYYYKRIIIVRWADLSDFFRSFSYVKCVFLFHVQ